MTDMMIAGSSVSTVIRMMICIGVLSELCPAGRSDGSRDGGAAARSGSARNARNTSRLDFLKLAPRLNPNVRVAGTSLER